MEATIAIAITTLRELLRSKALYTVLFFAVAMVATGALFGSVTIGDQLLVIQDFGLFSISLCGVVFMIVSGAGLLEKELSRKTIFNLLAKPVARWQFLVGKFLGMYVTVLLVTALMTACLHGFLFLLTGTLMWHLWVAYYYSALELLILSGAVIFFSSIVVTPLLAGLFTFGFFVAGRSVEYLLYFVEQGTISGLLASILEGAYAVLPQLSRLQVNDEIVFSLAQQSVSRALWGTIYSVGYTTLLLLFSVLFFRRREFN